jgi:hypothetical protein
MREHARVKHAQDFFRFLGGRFGIFSIAPFFFDQPTSGLAFWFVLTILFAVILLCFVRVWVDSEMENRN